MNTTRPPEILWRHHFHRTSHHDTGIVDHRVEPIGQQIIKGSNVISVGNVEYHGSETRGRQPRYIPFIAHPRDNVPAPRGKVGSDRRTDAASGASHQHSRHSGDSSLRTTRLVV